MPGKDRLRLLRRTRLIFSGIYSLCVRGRQNATDA